jgi:hypothetical protein
MRAPVYGLLVYPIGLAIGSAWDAALLINAILYPCNLVLVYWLLKRYLPKIALPLSLLFAVNPWVIEMLTRTVCETLLIFLCLLTLWLAERASIWAYLAGGIAIMTRYDAIGALLGAIIADLAGRRYRRALISGALSLVPLAIWMAGTYLSLSKGGHVHYVQLLSPSRLVSPSAWATMLKATLWPIPSSIVTILPLLLILGYGLWQGRGAWRWWLFGCMYAVVHLTYQFQEPRMYVPMAWVVLAAAAFAILRLIALRPRPTIVGLSLLLAADLVLSAPAQLGHGYRDAEFSSLIQWRVENLPAGERILTSMAELLRTADPQGAECYVPLRQVKGSILGYCRDNGITYLACDSRLLSASDVKVWYGQELLDEWRDLVAGHEVPGWRYITTIFNPYNRMLFIRIYTRQ